MTADPLGHHHAPAPGPPPTPDSDRPVGVRPRWGNRDRKMARRAGGGREGQGSRHRRPRLRAEEGNLAARPPIPRSACAGGRPHLVDQVCRHRVVVRVRRSEAAPAAGHRAQVDGVAQHLGGRDQRDDLDLAVADRARCPGPGPRLELRSPMTSPWWAAGTVTSSSLIGSSRTGSALAMASLKPMRAGHLEAHLRRVDRVVLAVEAGHLARRRPGSRRRRRCSIVSSTPFSTAGMNWRGMAPPTIWSTNSKPPPRSSGSTRRKATPNWPWPPVCFLYLPSASASWRDRLPVGDLHVLGLDLDAELALQALGARSPGGSRPCPTAASGGSRRCARGGGRGPRPEQAVQRGGELVLVALRLRPDGDGEHRLPAARTAATTTGGALGRRACRRWSCRRAWRRRRCRRPAPR